MSELPDQRLLDELSQQFMRAVRLTLGSDVAAEVSEAITPILGREWKDRLIINKLSGLYQTPNSISFQLVDEDTYRNAGITSVGMKIKAIKELRAMTGFGLVEAKKTVEDAETSAQVVQLSNYRREDNPVRWEAVMLASIDVLRSCGFEVNYA